MVRQKTKRSPIEATVGCAIETTRRALNALEARCHGPASAAFTFQELTELLGEKWDEVEEEADAAQGEGGQ
jgi:hypothetical protein